MASNVRKGGARKGSAMAMDVVVTYDVSAKQSEVKAAMVARGYMDRWNSNDGTTYYLPNTTLWKKNIELRNAVQDIAAVAKQFSVKLERAVTVPAAPWDGIPGEAHTK